jgi:hypothetical protein
MSVSVQSMLEELRGEIGAFETNLPDTARRDALDGLLGIKHVLFQRWEAQENAEAGGRGRVADPAGSAILVGGAQFLVFFVLGVPIAQALGVSAGAAVASSMTAMAITGAVAYRWLASPPKQQEPSLLERNRERVDEDPVFLIEEVQAYVKEQLDAVHGRFSDIRTEYEKAVILPRRAAETTLVELCQKRLEAKGREFPDEEHILAQIDAYIAECERVMQTNDDDERVARQLRETGEQLQALYKFPSELERVKVAYQSQADFLAGVDRIGVSIDATASDRSSTMLEVVSNLRELRREIGLTNRLMAGFQDYLAEQPDLQQILRPDDVGQFMDSLEESTVRPTR